MCGSAGTRELLNTAKRKAEISFRYVVASAGADKELAALQVTHQKSPLHRTAAMSPQPRFVLNPKQGDSRTVTFICTEPAPKVYLLTFSLPPDNRLTPTFLSTFLLALDILTTYPRGVVITTSALPKFYSNGLDFEASMADRKNFLSGNLYPLWRRLLTYPMPTVALVNGHAFAGGLMTAMMHDYRIMNPDRGFVCLNELEFGASFLPPMATIFRVKIPRLDTVRQMMLESRRYPGPEALSVGLIDAVGGLDEALKFVDQAKLVQKAQSPAYGRAKEELYREVIADLEGYDEMVEQEKAREIDEERRADEAKSRIEQWQRSKL